MTIISTTGAEDGEVLYGQPKKKKKDPKLTLAQIISFLIAKFRLKLKKVNKSLMIIQWRG